MKTAWDVVVVGGGFAGHLAALALARQGFRVLIVERGTQIGRDTRSGNLSTDGWCRAFGIKAPGWLAPIARRRAVWLDEGFMTVRAAEDGRELVAFRREDVDAFLRRVAEGAGVEVLEDFSAEEVLGSRDGPACVSAGGRTVAGQAVVVATGTDEQLLVRSGFLRPGRSRRVLVVCQQRMQAPVPAPGPTLHRLWSVPGSHDAVGYVLALEDEVYLNLTCAVDPTELSTWAFAPRELVERVKGHPFLCHMFEGARVLDWRTRVIGTLPPRARRLHGDRILLVGDAALPLGGRVGPGEGFAWAAATAHEAAAILARALERPTRLYLRAYAERAFELKGRGSASAVRVFRWRRWLRRAFSRFAGFLFGLRW